jgi:membrane protein DedA with SNARE-associated domain
MTDVIGWALDHLGVAGIALLMFAETVFPPIPSEIIMPLAGVHAAQTGHGLAGVIVAGTLGSMAGNIAWYLLAARLGLARFERWALRFGRLLTLDAASIARGQRLFAQFGPLLVGFGRMLPTVRSLISIPAGLVAMPVRTFLLYSTLGTAAWTAGLAIAGYLLGQNFAAIDTVLGPLSTAITAAIVVVYLYRVITWKVRPV